jgi:hypothetical protein
MSDTFRKKYRELTAEEIQWVDQIKSQAEALLVAIDKPRSADFPGNREIALAKTNLEQAVMWAIKAIT